MIKRPLGMMCLFLTGLIFLTIVWGEKRESRETLAFSDDRLALTGTVYQKRIGTDGREILYLKEEQTADKVICYLSKESESAFLGSQVLIEGKPAAFERATNPGQFDQQFYYQISGISFRLNQARILAKSVSYNRGKEALFKLRSFLAEQLEESLPSKEAAVVKTMLLGEKGELDGELKALYQRNGIAHILAISGLHISLLGMGAFKLLRRLGISVRISALAGGLLILGYGAMTGFSVSMLRAVLMFLLQMLSYWVGRTYDMLTALGVAAILLLAEQPLYLYDSGFLFSFGCVLGIGLLLPALTQGKHSFGRLKKGLLSGCAMAVVSFPLYLWFYYQFPPYSVLLNLLVLPLMTFLMAAVLVLILTSLIFLAAAFLPALIICGILQIYEAACSFCDRLPGHLCTIGKPEVWQLFLYLGILLAVICLQKKTALGVRWLLVAVAVFFLCIRPAGWLELTFLDVGQGDCIFIKSPSGNSYLIDGGSTSVSGVGKYRILPFLKFQGVDSLEAVLVTHPDTDHMNGVLELLKEGRMQGITVKTLVLPYVQEEEKDASYSDLEQAAKEAGIKIEYGYDGAKIEDKQLHMICLNPSPFTRYQESNEFSMVWQLTYGNFRALLTGDVEGRGEEQVLEALNRGRGGDPEGNMTLLKAAHHGSKYSTGPDFLEQTRPVYTVISCGRNNRYGHPHKEIIDRLNDMGTKIYLTMDSGAVSFYTDGEKVWVEEFLK